MGRTPCCEKVGLKRGRWTAQEDEILINYIRANGEGSWRLLPKKAGLLRCGKSCRLRWINYLRPDVRRGKFSSDEEDVIMKLHASLGNRWSMIASHLDGRTDNEIKNYWNSHLSRKAPSLPVSDRIKPMETSVVMSRLQKLERENAKKRRSKGPKTLLPNKINQRSNSPPRLSEVLEDYNQKVPPEPPSPFTEEESFGDILKWMPDKVSNECTRLPEQQGLLSNTDIGKDLASGTFLDSGFHENALIYDGFGMDFSHGVLGDVAFNGLETTLAPTTGDHELAEANQNLEMNASSMANSTSCITKESDENTGWDYFDGGMQGEVFWDPEQERMVMSWLW